MRRELSVNGKVMTYQSFSVSIFICDHNLLLVTERMRLWIQVAEISIEINKHLNRMTPRLTGEIMSLG